MDQAYVILSRQEYYPARLFFATGSRISIKHRGGSPVSLAIGVNLKFFGDEHWFFIAVSLCHSLVRPVLFAAFPTEFVSFQVKAV